MQGTSLYEFPVNLGKGARAISEPQFTGFEWYEAYGDRHADHLEQGRLVSLFRFVESWTSWEMHPHGEKVVCCIQGHMTLHQELPHGTTQSWELGPGDYAINCAAPGTHRRRRGARGRLVRHRRKGTTHRPG